MKSFFATDPDGIVHKRTSLYRTYTYTVVYQRSYADALEYAQKPLICDENNFKSLSVRVANNGRHIGYVHETEVEVANQLEFALEHLMGCSTYAEYKKAKSAERVAKVEAELAGGECTKWQNAGWCGRLDLARRLKSQFSIGRCVALILDASESDVVYPLETIIDPADEPLTVIERIEV